MSVGPNNQLTEFDDNSLNDTPAAETIVWALWHPEFSWGMDVPLLYSSKEAARRVLELAKIAPLLHGWTLREFKISPTGRFSDLAPGQ